MADENTQAGQGQGQPPTGQTSRKMSRRRSSVYEHFICFKDDQGNDRARCKYCGLELGANTKNGTSNLRTHVIICKARGGESSHPTSSSLPQPQPLQLQPSVPGEPSDREPACLEASRDLARMFALHGYDPSVLENDCFKSFVHRLNPQFQVPSRLAIEKMCSDIFGGYRRDQYLSNSIEDDDRWNWNPGKLSLAVGEAKSIETGQVVYVTTHFIDHYWNLHRLVEDVYMALPDDDYYDVLFQGVPVVPLHHVVDRIVDSIAYPSHPELPFCVYELFMIAGEMTGHINHLKLKDGTNQKLEWKIYYSATYMDSVLHSIARCLLPDSKFASDIFMSTEPLRITNLEKYKEIHTRLGLAKFGLLDDPWEYDERWYSCYCSLAILDPEVVLDSDDFTLELLHTLWREIYLAIKTVCDSSRPTSNLCLQELFKVRDVLQCQLLKAPDAAHAGNYSDFGNKSVADVLREALQTVDKAIKDSCLVWSIPLILDPQYKLRYIKFIFERAFGSEAEKYISEIRTKTKYLYTSYIKADYNDSGGIIEDVAVDSTNPLDQAWDEQCRSRDKTCKVDSHAEAKAELDCYLEDHLAPRTEDFDILDWWKQNSFKYPTVARMARDALAMPTCSKLTSDQMAHVRCMIRGYNKWW